MNTLVRCHRVTCRQCGSGTWVPVTWNPARCICADCRLRNELERKGGPQNPIPAPAWAKEANRVG